MQRRFSKEEQEQVRRINISLFLVDYDIARGTRRFSLDNKGYIRDEKNPQWVGNAMKNWWYDNSENASHKNGNIIDWLMYMSGEHYSFLETMTILLAYTRGEEWWQYLRNYENPFDYLKPEDLPFN